jgi:hypothetical protein
LTFGTPGALDPLASLTPIGPVQATYALMHLELDYGTILKDYYDPSVGRTLTVGDPALAGD